MTIKEKIFYIIGVLTFGGNIQEKEIEQAFKILDEFEKDLEVLEILKKHKKIPLLRLEQYINNSQKYGWTTKSHPLSVYDIDYTEEEFNKVKEWLENENSN